LALLFTFSVLPDADLLLNQYITHRGPTHSLFFSLLIFFPIFAIYRKKAIPYFVALLSHSFVGDIYSHIDGVQLFWPFSTEWFSVADISNVSFLSIGFELILFAISTTIILLNKDFQKQFFQKTSKIYWIVPFGSVLGPIVISETMYAIDFPPLLLLPSIFYMIMFSISIIGLNFGKKIKILNIE
jgi:membrane-bound metal-dependent hydrolase YbcI (DUF457 family)